MLGANRVDAKPGRAAVATNQVRYQFIQRGVDEYQYRV
jgi:hypothetical protein